MTNHLNKPYQVGLVVLLLLSSFLAWGQEDPIGSKFKDPATRAWFNTYGSIRLTDKLYWVAETHFRFQEDYNTSFAGKIGQIYNRHAISYKHSPSFRFSLGGVMRINFNQDEIIEPYDHYVVPEYRIWHEYLFSQSIDRVKLYHRLRIEHRWAKGFEEDSDYFYRNRWRYLFRAKVPINKPKLTTGAFYISPEAELIMQSGKVVVNSPLEDLRLTTSVGYILNSQLTLASGLMYSMGQQLADGGVYHQKYTIRVHMYYCLDFRKRNHLLPLYRD